jgi:hypothetical protein
MGYIAEPLQRSQLRVLARQILKIFGLENEFYFPVLFFLEHIIPQLYTGFYYEIVPKDEFSQAKHAETDVAGRIIRIREDVYYGAVGGSGRDRMTIMHEIAHYLLLVVCGVKFNRTFGATSVPTYQDPEWQAKALAGELMCPAHLISNLTVEQVMQKCGVSEEAAKYNLKIN